MMVPPLNSAEMDITMLMAKVDMVFSRLDTNKAQLRFKRHMSVLNLFIKICGMSEIKVALLLMSLLSFYQSSGYAALLKSTQPTLISVFTHESL